MNAVAEPNSPKKWTARAGAILVQLAKSAAVIYVGVLLVLMLLENWLVYRPMPAARGWEPAPPGVTDIELTSADGTRLHGWWHPRPDAENTLLYFHGNAGNLSHRGNLMVRLCEILKSNALIVDYPGYGRSAGTPSEAGCYAAAQAGYDWLTGQQKIEPGQIVLFGKSLGGGVAIELASRVEHRALVVVKSFSSMPDVGARLYPWLPVRWIMRNRFDSLSRIPLCRRPVFVAGATEDNLIPFSHSELLFDAANEPRAFCRLPGDHNDGLTPEFFDQLKYFLDQQKTAARDPSCCAIE